MQAFISYARRDQSSIAALRVDVERLGNRVWFDRASHGGQDWWDDVLGHVRDCAVFVFAVSPDSLRSKACLAELRYARALRRPVLPVLVRAVPELPADLADAVDYLHRTEEGALALRAALAALPTTRTPLPARLPEEPEIPTSYLSAYLARIDSPDLDETGQTELVAQLHERLADADERGDVWDLLVRLRDRPELSRSVSDAVEDLLAPGWQPDPRELFEARYWDGQSWTTLVWQNGREFNDRNQPPRVHAHLPATTTAAPPEPAQHARRRAPVGGRKLSLLVAAGVLAVGGGLAAALLLTGGGNDQESATRIARNFVDAVNTRDESSMQQYVCGKDRVDKAHLYGAFIDTANLTLERVDAGGTDPRFTILAARTKGNSSVRLNIPLTEEDGEWRVCDISRALSGR